MNIHYDAKTHGLFIRFAPGRYADSEEVTPGVVLDFDAKGRPLAIELEDVRGFIGDKALRELTRPRIRSGADLRAFRERLGVTQDVLGQMLDIPRNTIARWERDELSIEKSRVLELALMALLRRDEPPKIRGNMMHPERASERRSKPENARRRAKKK